MSSEPKLLKDYSADVKVAVPLIVEDGYKEVRTELGNGLVVFSSLAVPTRARARFRTWLCPFIVWLREWSFIESASLQASNLPAVVEKLLAWEKKTRLVRNLI